MHLGMPREKSFACKTFLLGIGDLNTDRFVNQCMTLTCPTYRYPHKFASEDYMGAKGIFGVVFVFFTEVGLGQSHGD